MHLISIKFNETNNTSKSASSSATTTTVVSTTSKASKQNLINYFRNIRFKKDELNKKQTELTLSTVPVRTVGTSSEFELSSIRKIRNFNSEIILIKKDKNQHGNFIDNSSSSSSSASHLASAKKLAIEAKLNDYLRLQQSRRNRFKTEKYTDVVAKEFIPSFSNNINKFENRNILNILKLTNRLNESEQQMNQISKRLCKSVQPNISLEYSSQLRVKGNNAVSKQYPNLQKSATIKAKLIPIKFNSKINSNLVVKSASNSKIVENDLNDLEPSLTKSQGVYTSAVTSSSQLQTYSKFLSSVSDETSYFKDISDQDIEYIYNQKQVNKLFLNISNKMRERTNSGKYKNRINIEGENLNPFIWPDLNLNQNLNSYKFFERNNLAYMNKIKPVKARWPLLSPMLSAKQKNKVKEEEEEEEGIVSQDGEDEDDDEAFEFDEELDYEDEIN